LDRLRIADFHAHRPAIGERLGRFLIKPLDLIFVIAVDDHASASLLQQRCVFRDRVIGFHLEAPPVRPDRRTNAFFRQDISDFVAFYRVVERCNLVAELLRHIDNLGHLVGAITMVVDENIAVEHPGQCFLAEIAFRRLGVVALAAIFLRIDPGLPFEREAAHASGRHPVATAIYALRILAAGHFHAIRRAGEFHRLHRPRWNIFQRNRAATKEICGTGKNLQRGDAAIGHRPGKTGILRPDAMLGPDFRGHRRRRFIAIAVRIDAGRRIVAEMAVHVDDTRRHIFAGAVDNRGAGWNGGIGTTNRGYFPIDHEHRAIVDPSAFPVEDGHTGDCSGS